jgi:hypothetical protein
MFIGAKNVSYKPYRQIETYMRPVHFSVSMTVFEAMKQKLAFTNCNNRANAPELLRSVLYFLTCLKNMTFRLHVKEGLY